MAKRLHKGVAQLAPATGHHRLRDGINAVPQDLRLDLARALGSNGRVDAPGEKQPKLASLPVPVRELHAALVGRVQHELLKVPSADEAGLMYLTPTTARKLAVAAVAGQLRLVDFKSASRLLLGQAAPEKDSLDELRETWALVRVALMATGEEIYGMTSSDPGVMRVEAKMHATAKSLRISAADLERWLKRVLESWELLCHDFRLLDNPMPKFKDCTDTHDSFISNQSAMASLAMRMKGEILQELKKTTGSARPDKFQKKPVAGDGGKPKNPSHALLQHGGEGVDSSAAGAGRPGNKTRKRKEGPSAWPDMPMMKKEGYTAFRKEVSGTVPESCVFFLASRCSKGSDCPRSHDVPDGYDAIKRKHAARE